MAMNENMGNMKEIDILDVLLDDDNHENIVLKAEDGKTMSFAQVAVIPLKIHGEHRLYCLLRPLDKIKGIDDDVAIVFLVETDYEGNSIIRIEEDDEVAKAAYERYLELLEDANAEAEKTV